MRQQGLPMVYGLPFLGILHKCLPIHNILYTLGSYFEELKSCSYLAWFANVPIIISTDTEIIKHILNSDVFLNKSGVIYERLSEAVSNGIITSKYFKWKHNRKLMNPLFAPQIVQQFIPNFNKCSKRISKYFESLSSGEQHAVFDRIKQEVLKMAMDTTLGSRLVDGENLYGNMGKSFNILFGKMVRDILLSLVKLSFLTQTSCYYEIKDNLFNYIENLIKSKMDSTIENKDKHFLDRAIKYLKQNIFSKNDVITETYTTIIASFETVSTTLYSIIIMLAMHQDVQQKLYEEIIQVIANTENIDYKHLDQLPYLNMVIDETLRLMPPIPLIGRESMESCHLTDSIQLPKDFQIIISIFHLHRRQDLWGTKATQFNPDNFLPENIEKRHPYAFIPYSKGMRNCIGWRYAQIALKVLVLNLVREVQFSTDFPYNDLVFVNQVSLRFLKEPKIQFVKR
ncbi:probable cytochrome P450 313a4 [Lucilia cuprina]|uniref:probable cytochrome P450 313a4 n=1 Tax=Lucilia cuprina TaxID=7375 RepID=UPI001F059BFA|nr:probable cytochrome P450 313a4 [Lucilia cuprina]